jgi:hypothetical protein
VSLRGDYGLTGLLQVMQRLQQLAGNSCPASIANYVQYKYVQHNTANNSVKVYRQ